MNKRNAALGAALSLLTLLASARCVFPGTAPPLRVATWNAQNLFDASRDGTEYPEFVPGSKWTRARYLARLDRLARAVVEVLGCPDILCLQEIENARVAHDLAAALDACGYSRVLVAKAGDAATGCAVLSRVPIVSARTHAVRSRQPTRPVLEVEFAPSAEPGSPPLRLFVCHWKSKGEGARETEETRRAQSAVVRARLAEIFAADPMADVIVAGDLNENPDEAELVAFAWPTALAHASIADARSLPLVVSPGEFAKWPTALLCPWKTGFSYRHEGRDERIDHFLLSRGLFDAKGATFLSFAPVAAPSLLDASGDPRRWSEADPEGVSDHLPLVLELSLSP